MMQRYWYQCWNRNPTPLGFVFTVPIACKACQTRMSMTPYRRGSTSINNADAIGTPTSRSLSRASRRLRSLLVPSASLVALRMSAGELALMCLMARGAFQRQTASSSDGVEYPRARAGRNSRTSTSTSSESSDGPGGSTTFMRRILLRAPHRSSEAGVSDEVPGKRPLGGGPAAADPPCQDARSLLRPPVTLASPPLPRSSGSQTFRACQTTTDLSTYRVAG